jgi:Sigma-70 region 2
MEYTSTVTIGGWRERLGSLSIRREELDDKELVARTLSGDLRSYEELVGRYERLVGRVVYPYARREISVEDLVQETFLRAYDRLETFNPDYRFKTWRSPTTSALTPYGAAGRSSSSTQRPTPLSRRVLKPRPSMPTVPGV